VAAALGTTLPARAAPPVLDASDVWFHDRPSDDGSALILEWVAPLTRTEALAKARAEAAKNRETLTEAELLARIPSDAVDVSYVIQVARQTKAFATEDLPPEDTPAKAYKTIEVLPGPKTRKTADPKYFGFSPENAKSCFLMIEPSDEDLFGPSKPWAMSESEVDPATEQRIYATIQSPEEAKLIESLGAKGMIPELDGTAGAAFGLVLQLWLSQRVEEGLLTEAEAARAMAAWPIFNAYGADAAVAKKQANDALIAANDGLSAARAARIEAEIALGTAADGDEEKAAKQVLADAKAVEKQAKQDVAAATRQLKWAGETVRSQLPVEQRRELDWFIRLRTHLIKRHDERVKTADRQFNASTFYVQVAVSGGGVGTPVRGPDGEAAIFAAAARPDLFKWFTLSNLVFAMTFTGIVLAFIQIARRNPNLFLRKIAGLDAVEEAIGRATEMGRPAFFVHGHGSTGSMSVIAALNILSRVARQAAEYDTHVRVMNLDPLVTAVGQEVVQQAYIEAGRPDAYDTDDVVYMTSEQFSYAAAVAGRMMREQPAAIFLIGYFMAESLLLAETGTATGAIQVAGTDAEHQLPFFITTCDYTLIGEELYAASAYLSREPRMLGSLRGQDVAKALMMVVMFVGIILTTITMARGKDWSWIGQLFQSF